MGAVCGALGLPALVGVEGILDEVARQSSAMERRAEEAERETIKMKKAEYMEGKIGEEYDGIIQAAARKRHARGGLL